MRLASALLQLPVDLPDFRGVSAGFRLNKGQIDEPAGGLSEDLIMCRHAPLLFAFYFQILGGKDSE